MKKYFSTALFLLASSSSLVIASPPKQSTDSIYAFRDANGVVNFSNIPALDKRYKLMYQVPKIGPNQPRSWNSNTPSVIDYTDVSKLISEVSSLYSIDSRLIHAIIKVESGYDINAKSSAGAEGLMQLMPSTASRYGVVNSFNARDNITGGVKYFKDLLKMFNNNIELALAGYNAGENAVIKFGYKIPPYEETKNYVPKVLTMYNINKKL